MEHVKKMPGSKSRNWGLTMNNPSNHDVTLEHFVSHYLKQHNAECGIA